MVDKSILNLAREYLVGGETRSQPIICAQAKERDHVFPPSPIETV